MQTIESFLEGQRLDPDRYSLIPRTLSFLTRPGQVLLMKVAEDRGSWAGLYNGIGGHIKRGEDPVSAARREIREETGLQPVDLALCGVIAIDTGGDTGIGLYTFIAKAGTGTLRSSAEGTAEWIADEQVLKLPLVYDVPFLLQQSMHAYRRRQPFSAVYRASEDGTLEISLAE